MSTAQKRNREALKRLERERRAKARGHGEKAMAANVTPAPTSDPPPGTRTTARAREIGPQNGAYRVLVERKGNRR